MNSAGKPGFQSAQDRANLIAQLASRGFYVIGEVWRDPDGEPSSDNHPTRSPDTVPDPAAPDRP
jgi:hypothetical protein